MPRGDVRRRPSSFIMHAALAEQIWMFVKARSHLLAETLRRKMSLGGALLFENKMSGLNGA